jgi:predicted CoA-binding protein
MTPTKEAARTFLAGHRIAVTGVSHAPKGHGSNAVYDWLKKNGYEAFAVNPNAARVGDDATYPSLAAIPGGVDGVVIGTRPDHAEGTMREAVELGITQVWMHRAFGGGSVSDAATAYGREHGVTVIDGGCPLMFADNADAGHRFFCRIGTWTKKVPKQV